MGSLSQLTEDVSSDPPLATDVVHRRKEGLHRKQAPCLLKREGQRLIPDPRFEVEGSYLGVDTTVIDDRNSSRGPDDGRHRTRSTSP